MSVMPTCSSWTSTNGAGLAGANTTPGARYRETSPVPVSSAVRNPPTVAATGSSLPGTSRHESSTATPGGAVGGGATIAGVAAAARVPSRPSTTPISTYHGAAGSAPVSRLCSTTSAATVTAQ